MKKLFLLISAVMLTVSGAMAQTDDKFYIEDFQLDAGSSAKVAVNLTNPEHKFVAFQFSLTLPDGIRIGLDKRSRLDVTLNSERIDDHTIASKETVSGHYNFLCYSGNNYELNEAEGPIVYLTIEADASLADGVYAATLEKVMLSTKDIDVFPEDQTFNITIGKGGSTGISSVAGARQQAEAVYDLNGRRVNGADLQRGLYIAGGRKLVVK